MFRDEKEELSLQLLFFIMSFGQSRAVGIPRIEYFVAFC
jgi:hypothetical protein